MAVVVVGVRVLLPPWTSIGWILLKFAVDRTHWSRPGPGGGVTRWIDRCRRPACRVVGIFYIFSGPRGGGCRAVPSVATHLGIYWLDSIKVWRRSDSLGQTCGGCRRAHLGRPEMPAGQPRARCVPRRRSSRCSIEFSLRTSGVESLLFIMMLLCDHIVALVVAIGGVQRGEREAPCEGGGVGRQWTGFGASIRSAGRMNGIHIVPRAMGQYGYAWFCSFREKRSLDGSRVRKQSFATFLRYIT